MDKAGNFIGWLHIDGANLSVLLVEHALSKVRRAQRLLQIPAVCRGGRQAKKGEGRLWNGAWRGKSGCHLLPSLPSTPALLPPYYRQRLLSPVN